MEKLAFFDLIILCYVFFHGCFLFGLVSKQVEKESTRKIWERVSNAYFIAFLGVLGLMVYISFIFLKTKT